MAQWDALRVEVRQLMALSLPVIGTQLANVALSTTDVLMAGRLGARELAAVAVGFSLGNPLVYTSMGVLVAVGPIVSQLYGAERFDALGEKVRQGIWLSFFLSAINIVLLNNMAPLMHLTQVSPEVIPVAEGYLKALGLGFPFLMIYFALRFFNEGISLTKPAFIVSLIAIPVNVLANWVLMYGKFGFPAMGAVGTGYATSVVWICMFLSLTFWTFTRKRYARYHLNRFSKPRFDDLKEIIVLGVPNAATVFMEISMFAVFTLMMGRLGTHILAAHQVAINIAAVSYMIPLGIGIALSTRVGQAAGQGSLAQVKLSGYTGIWVCVVITAITAVLLFLMRGLLVGLYTDDATVAVVATGLVFYAALFQLSDGLQVSAVGALRGLKDTHIPMWINGFAYWVVGLPLGLYLGLGIDIGAKGLWIGLISGLTVGGILHNIRFYFLTRKSLPGVS